MKESTKSKVAFVCHFSNEIVRQHLQLKTWNTRNFIFRLLRHPEFHQFDFDVWVSDYIEQFERHPELEYHIIAPHRGMVQRRQDFVINGIHYHFIKLDSNLVYETLDAKLHLAEKFDYRRRRKVLNSLIEEVNPDLVVVCGAENPEYSSVALEVKKRPLYLLLQTVLNNPQYTQHGFSIMNVGYKAEMEKRIFRNVHYFGTNGPRYYSLFKAINPDAVCVSSHIPSHQPLIFEGLAKEYDFVFYGRLTKIKGVGDVIKAMDKVVKLHPEATLCVLDSANDKYGKYLRQLIEDGGFTANVKFISRLDRLEDVYIAVQKSRCAVLPGITSFNSTVRESMLMGLPVIVYELPKVKTINAEGENLLAARLEDVDDLAAKMNFVLENPDKAAEIASNGKKYAEQAFNNNCIGDKLVANFQAIIANYYDGTPLPQELVLELPNE